MRTTAPFERALGGKPLLYVVVLDGPDAVHARPVVSTKDPEIVQVVADAIAARLRTKPLLAFIEHEHSVSDPSGTPAEAPS
jgi:hypothetical protein